MRRFREDIKVGGLNGFTGLFDELEVVLATRTFAIYPFLLLLKLCFAFKSRLVVIIDHLGGFITCNAAFDTSSA